MNIKQAFILALKSLTTSKMRSFLTMLGIIIGVASVIILVSLVDGMKNTMLETFESMGTNLISVTVMGRGSNRTVSDDDMMNFVNENPDLYESVSPVVSVSNATIKYKTENDTTTATGVNEYYSDINSIELSSGRFLEYVDVERRQKNCVIGSYIAQTYFDGDDPLGKEIKLAGTTFQVIGIVTETASSAEDSADDVVYIPYTVATTLSRNGTISSYQIAAINKDVVSEAAEKVDDFLYSIFNNTNAYRVMNLTEILDQVNELTGQMTLLLVGIAGISLLVGGIGIMNIMLVSVTERTREIGIRKSLGATPWDIMSQFVVEAATTSSCGGVLGIILGSVVAILLGNAMGFTVFPSFSAIAISFSVSLAIGMTFGYFPAKKASRLNPIEALRYD